MGAETTIGVSDEQKETLEDAREQLESELGVSVTQGDAVAKLARDYVGESA